MISLTLSFDDAPTSDGAFFTSTKRAEKICEAFTQQNVQEAVFYCNTFRAPLESLEIYSSNGHAIANHTSTHPDLTKVSADEFKKRILDAENSFKHLSTFKKWFRFPYLREAHKDIVKNNEIKEFLLSHKYQFGFITIETYDWYLNDLLQKTKRENANIDLTKVRDLYLKILFETIDHGIIQAREILGDDPIHVVLLHENDLNALFLGDFLHQAKLKYSFASASSVFSDPIADQKWNKLPKCMRRIEAIANNMDKEILAPSPWLSEEKIKHAYDALDIG